MTDASVDVVRLTAAETAAAIARGELSAVEATQAALDRIAKVDDAVRAFLHVDAQGALTTAAAVDARRAGGGRRGGRAR
ncbi:Asp-tRNA(Asn)/Glu-tRNA(Gln) amidotransferase GatCAB subunit A, partial [Frankia sp. CN4]|nr:Asp-tRNA(Asn)/Glu-tRNA(Gln) amidotransferase GatCAB subunit A [Frankia nepalensis]